MLDVFFVCCIFMEGLCKIYCGCIVVNGVLFEVVFGEIVGFFGLNGVGKMMIFYMVVGLMFLDDGCVFFGEEEIIDMLMYLWVKCGVSYLLQEVLVFCCFLVEGNLWVIFEMFDLLGGEFELCIDMFIEDFNFYKVCKSFGYDLLGGE